MLDGYFHQDYRYIYVTPVGAARAFAADASEEEVRAAHAELEAFITWAATTKRARWQQALADLGGTWMPSTLEPLRTVLRGLERVRRPGGREDTR
jgi:hypothetical protein